MSPADVLIIYLAAGTPFGVYSLLDLRGKFRLRSLFLIALKYVVWPFFAGLGIYRYVTGTNLEQKVAPASLERSIANIRFELKSISAFDSKHTEIRELLFAFDTYIGLSEIAAYSNGNRPVQAPALLEPVEHPAPLIAARCIERHNRALLEAHCDRAEHELRAAVIRIEEQLGNETNMRRLVDNTVELFSTSLSTTDPELGFYSDEGILFTA